MYKTWLNAQGTNTKTKAMNKKTVEYRLVRVGKKDFIYRLQFMKTGFWGNCYWVNSIYNNCYGHLLTANQKTEQDARDYVQQECEYNPKHVTFIEHPMLIMF